MRNSVIYIGWINKNKPADCGETMKNQLCIKRLEELGINVRQMDFKRWKKRPWVLFQLAWNMIFHKDETLIFSTSTKNVYPLMKLMQRFHWKQNVVHWVIGGNLGENTLSGKYKADVLNVASHTLVESSLMTAQLEACGVRNVMTVPNFKPINFYPSLHETNSPMRFVFLSRIMEEKGCKDILDAADALRDKYTFSIDFYGKINDNFKEYFLNRLSENVRYKGFLDLTSDEGYKKLSEYDVMLFPTFWKGEGFAGVFIDAFISGLPIIATDWAHNKAFLEEEKTAMFIPVHNPSALAEKMAECIDEKYDINMMSQQCQKEALKYDVNNVITEDLITQIL